MFMRSHRVLVRTSPDALVDAPAPICPAAYREEELGYDDGHTERCKHT